MKKVKLMLLSLSILAIVGGALAFTSRTGTQVCYAHVPQNANCANFFCPDVAELSVTTDPDMFVCTTSIPAGGCHEELPCAGVPINKTIQ